METCACGAIRYLNSTGRGREETSPWTSEVAPAGRALPGKLAEEEAETDRHIRWGRWGREEIVISVWFDETSDSDDPKWIISMDTLDMEGGSICSTTLDVFDVDDYEQCLEDAQASAKEKGLRLVVEK